MYLGLCHPHWPERSPFHKLEGARGPPIDSLFSGYRHILFVSQGTEMTLFINIADP